MTQQGTQRDSEDSYSTDEPIRFRVGILPVTLRLNISLPVEDRLQVLIRGGDGLSPNVQRLPSLAMEPTRNADETLRRVFIRPDPSGEDSDDSRQRATKPCPTSVENVMFRHCEQLETWNYTAIDATPSVLVAYLVLIPWDYDGNLPSGMEWVSVSQIMDMEAKHYKVIMRARERLRAKLQYSNIGFAITPRTFTLRELADAYEGVLGYPVSTTNMFRVLERRRQLTDTGETRPAGSEGGRPARIFEFSSCKLEITDPAAIFRPTRKRIGPINRG